ncbi:Ubiquinone/menaquinone biosynthesis C-methylase UbiE [Rhizobiales bacterium GAS191]|nr:Ubiquinone/menaquinone biosynthesis C-methylase UbiE [Rhizobiales bacterium GAS191]
MTEPSPDRFLDAALGYQKTAAIKAALALDLFTAIAQKDGDIERVAAHTRASSRGIRILCDYLTILGFLEKDQGRQYRLTPSTELFLTRSSPAWIGSVVDFLASPEMMALWLEDPVSYVSNGGSPGLANIAPDNPVWVKFAKAMVPLIAPAAQGIAQEVGAWPSPPRKVLDVAAGHGMFGIALAKAIPQAEVTAIDWQSVLAVAKENAVSAGVSERYRTIPGSAFEVDWGSDFDLVLLTNFLHHFDEETCVGLLAKARKSMKPKGRILAVEMVPNEDRVSPPFSAMFSFMMLGSTPRGDAYTARELEEMGRKAGFPRVAVKALLPSPMSLVALEQA